MLVTCVYVCVEEDRIEDFIAASVENHRNSVQEPGNLRFDVLQRDDDPSRFILYEAYESEDAAAAHKETDHYRKWRETVTDWMAQPREGVKHRVIVPADKSGW